MTNTDLYIAIKKDINTFFETKKRNIFMSYSDKINYINKLGLQYGIEQLSSSNPKVFDFLYKDLTKEIKNQKIISKDEPLEEEQWFKNQKKIQTWGPNTPTLNFVPDDSNGNLSEAISEDEDKVPVSENKMITLKALDQKINKLKLCESKFGRVMGKFQDYASKVINVLKRNNVDENQPLDLALIAKCFSLGNNARECANFYLQKKKITENKIMKKNLKETFEIGSVIHLEGSDGDGISSGDYKILNNLIVDGDKIFTLEPITVSGDYDPYGFNGIEVTEDYLKNKGYWKNAPNPVRHGFRPKVTESLIKESIDLTSVIPELEQKLPNYAYTEWEQPGCVRIDYGNENSIWLFDTGSVEIGGKIGPNLQKYLKSKGFKLNESKQMKNKKLLKETGEWDDNDEEMKSWKEALRDQLKIIKRKLGKDFIVKNITGFDNYQGPYSNCSYKGRNLKFWLDEDGRLLEQNTGVKGTGEEFAIMLKNNLLNEIQMKNKNLLKETSHEIPSPKYLINYEEQDIVTAIKKAFENYDGATCSQIAAVGDSQFYNVAVTLKADDEYKDLEAKRFVIAQRIHKLRAELFVDLSSILPVVNINMGNYEFTKNSDTVKCTFTILMSQTNQRDWVSGEYKQKDKVLGKKLLDAFEDKEKKDLKNEN